ncbi:hypothetical protein BSQ99_03900 [Serratia liquefaciens]|nr:hypothetical protein BSQ99_03900 [Serratia liquefaciens]
MTKRYVFWTAKGGPQGERSESSPLSPPYFKEKAWTQVQAFLLPAAQETPWRNCLCVRFAVVFSKANTG